MRSRFSTFYLGERLHPPTGIRDRLAVAQDLLQLREQQAPLQLQLQVRVQLQLVHLQLQLWL